MPTDRILSLLIAERDKLSKAIDALQDSAKRRGRPPKNPVSAEFGDRAMPNWVKPALMRESAKGKRRTFTAAQREQQAERMRQYWAAKRKAASAPKKKGRAASGRAKKPDPKKAAT